MKKVEAEIYEVREGKITKLKYGNTIFSSIGSIKLSYSWKLPLIDEKKG